MRRRIIGPACLLTTVAALVFGGCDTLRPSTRKKAEKAAEAVEVEAEEAANGAASRIPAINSDPKKPTPFFKNSRLTGGLSEEARDIEASLGVR